MEVLWVSYGCTTGAPCSFWSQAAAQNMGWVKWPWHRDELVIPKDTAAPWSCACLGEGEEHPEHLLPTLPSHRCLRVLQWPEEGCPGVGLLVAQTPSSTGKDPWPHCPWGHQEGSLSTALIPVSGHPKEGHGDGEGSGGGAMSGAAEGT